LRRGIRRRGRRRDQMRGLRFDQGGGRWLYRGLEGEAGGEVEVDEVADGIDQVTPPGAYDVTAADGCSEQILIAWR